MLNTQTIEEWDKRIEWLRSALSENSNKPILTKIGLGLKCRFTKQLTINNTKVKLIKYIISMKMRRIYIGEWSHIKPLKSDKCIENLFISDLFKLL